jgi:hypothetical protein
MSRTEEELLVNAETLKNILISIATTGGVNDTEYASLRREIIHDARIAHLVPTFLKTCRNGAEFWGFIKFKFPKYQERRDYLQQQFDPLLTSLENGLSSPGDADVQRTLACVGWEHVQETWQKALERRAVDPEGAVTAARTLLETVCKHILEERSVAYDDKMDLPKLYSLVAKSLGLSPDKQAARSLNQVLGGCHAIVEGLGAFRNTMSDAHGRGKEGLKPTLNQAQLAVNVSGAVASFLVAIHSSGDTQASPLLTE